MGEETRRKKLEIRNGEWEREGASRIGRRRWVCWGAGIPTRGSAWKRWRLVDAVPMKPGTPTRRQQGDAHGLQEGLRPVPIPTYRRFALQRLLHNAGMIRSCFCHLLAS